VRAAKQATPKTRAEYPAVPWSAAARMRDRLVHHYFDIDLDVLWSTIVVDLPALLDVFPARSLRPDATFLDRNQLSTEVVGPFALEWGAAGS
jgi:hypothetical protein